MSSCSAAEHISSEALEIFLSYRLLIIIIWLTFINIFLEHVQKRFVTRFAVYEHLEPETCQEIGTRCLQLFFGLINSVSGIGFLLYFAASGCNMFDVYVYYIAGASLVSIDVHEYVARWPLRVALLAQKLVTFILALALIEFGALPANDDRETTWGTALFLANLGLLSVFDFYHVLLRASNNLALIKRMRKLYLFGAIIRVVNIVLLFSGSAEAAMFGSWFGFGCLLFMAIAYTYNTYLEITLVTRFDCDKYYDTHQKRYFVDLKEECVTVGWFSIAFLPSKERADVQHGVRGDRASIAELEPFLDMEHDHHHLGDDTFGLSPMFRKTIRVFRHSANEIPEEDPIESL